MLGFENIQEGSVGFEYIQGALKLLEWNDWLFGKKSKLVTECDECGGGGDLEAGLDPTASR